MKFIFFLVLLINSIFFLWQYRKGAPEIYLPRLEKNSSASTETIILLDHLPEVAAEIATKVQINRTQTLLESVKQKMTDNGAELVGPRPLQLELQANRDEVIRVTQNIGGTVSRAVDPHKETTLSLRIPPHSGETQAVETNIMIESGSNINDPIATEGSDLPEHKKNISACFQLQAVSDKQQILDQNNKQNEFELSFVAQEQAYISNFLVLTLAADSLQQAIDLQEILIQQGIDDLWLFKKGKFKWQISLGLFSTAQKAADAKEVYSRKIAQMVVVTPSFQQRTVTQVILYAQQEAIISSFAKKYAHYIDQKVSCMAD